MIKRTEIQVETSQASETFLKLSSAKRERILEAATDEFAEFGFHQASVSRLVRRLGIAKGSIFQYFGSKQGMFEYLFERFVERFKGPLKAVRAQETDFFERVRRSLIAGLDFIEAHPRIYAIYLKVLYQENAPFREKFLRRIRLYSAEYLRPLIAEAKADGQLRADLDEDLALFVIDGLLDRFLQARSVPFLHEELFTLDRQAARERAGELAAMLRHGLGSPDRDNANHKES